MKFIFREAESDPFRSW